jgi:hypothetical protein
VMLCLLPNTTGWYKAFTNELKNLLTLFIRQ